MPKEVIQTNEAPQPIGTYSQAIKAGGLLFTSVQLPLVLNISTLISDDPAEQIYQCFENLKQIAEAAGTDLNQAVKINIYYTDTQAVDNINWIMEELFLEPYPARGMIKVNGLAKKARVAIEGIFCIKAETG